MNKRQFRIILGLLVLYFCYVILVPAQAVSFDIKLQNNDNDSGYSGVMTDLMSNPDFNISDYMKSNMNQNVDVITVAESMDNSLYIYVYEPYYMSNYLFTSINISMVDKSQPKDFRNYKLSLIDRQSKFCKYLVNDLTVGEPHRYEISSILRGFIDNVDETDSGGNIVSEVPHPIGKIFTFIDGQLNVEDVEYIQITDKYVGFVRYYGGTTLFSTNECDSHFVAFSTDKKIEKLLEADVYFQTQKWRYVSSSGVSSGSLQGSPIDNYSYMTENDEVFFEGTGLFNHSYSWSRIQTAKEFIDSQNFENVYQGFIVDQKAVYNMTDESKTEIENKQWVLRFYESTYGETQLATGWSEMATCVFNVSILRLKFETDGVVYDLGVIDNKQTGSNEPSNETTIQTTMSDNLSDMLKKIFGLLLIVVAVVFLAPILPLVLSLLVFVIKFMIGIISKFFATIKKILKGIIQHE